MENPNKPAGFGLAVLASCLLIGDTLLLVMTFLTVWQYSWFKFETLSYLWHSSPLPFVIYLIWFVGLAGTVTAIVSIAIYGFRERWFWRVLLIAAIAWLAFPPIHALIGLLAFVLLLRTRNRFPVNQPQTSPAP